MKKQLITTLLGILCATSTFAGTYQIGLNSTNLGTGTLNGLLETPPNASTATGGTAGAGLSYDSGLGVLNVNLAYGFFGLNPLQGSYTAAHIHQAPVGVAGPVVIDLSPIHLAIGPNAGYFSGSVPFSPALENALWSSDLYINIHSTLFPGGEIRGQLVPVTIPEPSTFVFVAAGLGLMLLIRRR